MNRQLRRSRLAPTAPKLWLPPPLTSGLLSAGGKRLADGSYQKADMAAVPAAAWEGPTAWDGGTPVNLVFEDRKFKDTRKPLRGQTTSCLTFSGYHNLTVRRCAYWGYGNFLGGSLGGGWLLLDDCDAQAMLLLDDWIEHGRFCDLSDVGGILIANNYGDGIATFFINNAANNADRKINRNLFKNISGGFVTPAGYYPGKSMKQAAQINGGTNTDPTKSTEIGWNIVLNEPGAGRCEDIFSLHDHKNTSARPAKVHHNLLDQNHGTAQVFLTEVDGDRTEASNGGIMSENGTEQVDVEDNVLLNVSVYGIAAAGDALGVRMRRNRVVNTGRFLSGPDAGKIIPHVNCGLYSSGTSSGVLMEDNYLACVFANMPSSSGPDAENMSLASLVRNDIGDTTPAGTTIGDNYYYVNGIWVLNDRNGDGDMIPASLVATERAAYYQQLRAKQASEPGFGVGPMH